jgi:hypothetical protein
VCVLFVICGLPTATYYASAPPLYTAPTTIHEAPSLEQTHAKMQLQMSNKYSGYGHKTKLK